MKKQNKECNSHACNIVKLGEVKRKRVDDLFELRGGRRKKKQQRDWKVKEKEPAKSGCGYGGKHKERVK